MMMKTLRHTILVLMHETAHLSRRTVQIYQELGLWSALQEHATPILEVNITEQGSFGKARLKAEQEKVESFGQVIENAWLGRVLLTEVQKQPLIELIDGVQVTPTDPRCRYGLHRRESWRRTTVIASKTRHCCRWT